jgi:hypothetical protein
MRYWVFLSVEWRALVADVSVVMSSVRYKVERMLIVVIPIVAVAVFVNQLVRHHLYDLSTWKGGGMGMFAAWDRPSRARFINIYATDVNGERLPITEIGSSIYDLKYQVETEPSPQNFDRLITKLGGTQWFMSDSQQPVYTQNAQGQTTFIKQQPVLRVYGSRTAALASIEFEYGEIRYNRNTHTLTPVVVEVRRHAF